MGSGYSTYNGHNGDKRGRVQAWLTERFRDGRLPPPTDCVLCGTTHGRIDAHLENYDNPTDYIGLCVTCHLALHARFHQPKRWTDRIALIDREQRGRGTIIAAAILDPAIPKQGPGAQ